MNTNSPPFEARFGGTAGTLKS